MEILVQDLDDESLQRIEEISSLCERIERAVDALGNATVIEVRPSLPPGRSRFR